MKLTHYMPVLPSIETSQLICCANQLTGFYMRETLVLNVLIDNFEINFCEHPCNTLVNIQQGDISYSSDTCTYVCVSQS